MSNEHEATARCHQQLAEPLPDPREAARAALALVPHFYPPDVETALMVIEHAGLTFCWRV